MSNDNYSRIENYLTGRLSDADKKAFEQATSQDQALADELALHRLEHRAMKLAVQDDLRATMADWRQDRAEAEESEAKVIPLARRRRLRSVLSIAASALLLLAVGGSWWANQNFSDNALALSFADTPSLNQRSGEANDDPLLQADLALKAGNPTAVIELLKENTDPNARLLMGNAYLQSGNYSLAANYYTEVLDTGSQAQRELAEWQLVLTALANGQPDNAQQLLQTLIDQQPAHSYQKKARDLQQKLNSGWRKLAW